MIPVCLLQHKSMLNPKVRPAIAQVLLLLENELLELHLQQAGIHLAHSPLPSQHPRAKKTHRLWFVPSEISLSEAPDERAWTAGNMSAPFRRAECQGSTRCQMPPVICFNCYLNHTHFTMKQLISGWTLRDAWKSQNRYLLQGCMLLSHLLCLDHKILHTLWY